MYFSRIQLNPGHTELRDIIGLGATDGYRLHQSLWRLFKQQANEARPFLYRQQNQRGIPFFYTVSSTPPRDENNRWQIETRDYQPTLTAGRRLAFSLLANPIVSRRDPNGRQQRHDVVMDLKRQSAPGKRPPMAELEQQAGHHWLSKRAENLGFQFDENHILINGYRQQRLHKPKARQPIRFSTLEFNGILTVQDPETFLDKALYQGIGPAKGFGCGLLLIRPV